MANSSLSAPFYNYKTECVDLSSSVVLSMGASLKDKVIERADKYVGEGIFMPTSRQPLRLWNIDGEIYVFVYGGDLYKLEDGVFKLYSAKTFNVNPKIVHVKYEGKTTPLVMTDYEQVLCMGLNPSTNRPIGDVEISIPKCDDAIFFEGVLYLAKNDTLYIGKEYDYSTSSFSVAEGASVILDSSAGKILALKVINGELYIFCQRKIFVLKAYGDRINYQLKVVKTSYLNIVEDSICSNAQTAYFISDNKLCYFDGNTVKKVDCLLDKGEIAIAGKAYAQGDRYVVPVTVEDVEGSFAFCYNLNGEQFIVNTDGVLIGDDGYGINALTGELVKLKPSLEQVDYFVKLKPSTFNSTTVKTILAFSVWMGDRGKLKLVSEYDSSNFTLAKGINYRKINQKSGKISFEFSGKSNDVKIEGLTATYLLREEIL